MEAANLLRRAYWPLLKKAGLPQIPFHALRHTAATLLLRKGIHPKIVQELLGHSSIAITLDLYSHAVPTMQREATAAMDALLAGIN
jgi:integrase